MPLMQEEYPEPWQMIVSCQLLNRSGGVVARRVARELFARWPGPEGVVGASLAEIEGVLRPLGLWRRRAALLRRFALEWLDTPEGQREARVLAGSFSGCGPYVAESWRVFQMGDLSFEPGDRVLRSYVHLTR